VIVLRDYHAPLLEAAAADVPFVPVYGYGVIEELRKTEN
jgi:hypothetical protein